MHRRPYGETGESLSIIGFGGIVVSQTEPAEAERLVADAVNAGINYFDVAPTYGNAEERLGPALRPYRGEVFLACKTTQRLRADVERELEQSLRRLHTDHVDLYQMHAVNTEEDFALVSGPGGALEAFQRAREAGKVRYLGFSSHSVSTALRLLDQIPFDSVLFPVNWVQYLRLGFGPQVITRAQEKGVARLALKALAYGKRPAGDERKRYSKCWYLPITDPELARLALRFTLSRPITAAIPPGEADLFRMAVDIATDYTPITEEEEAELRHRAASAEPIFAP